MPIFPFVACHAHFLAVAKVEKTTKTTEASLPDGVSAYEGLGCMHGAVYE